MVFGVDSQDFIKLSKQEKHPQKRVRLIAMGQLKAGKAISEVAESLGLERHTVGEWYKRYNKFGLQGLDTLPRPGRQPKIPKNKESEFLLKIEAMQELKNGGRVTGYEIQAMAFKDFGAHYADDSIYTVLKRIGASWITARSKHPKTDSKAQEDFKKISDKQYATAYLKKSI